MKDYILNLDRPRRLKFGFKASRLIREVFGDKGVEVLEDMNIDEFPKIAWCGLVWEDADLTVEIVEEMLDKKIPSEYTITGIIELVSGAIIDHMGVDLKSLKKEGEKKKKKKSQVKGMIPSGRPEKQPTKSA